MSKTILIDGGANRGQLFNWCFDKDLNVKYDKESKSQWFAKNSFLDCEFYLFEPTISLNKYLNQLQKNYNNCKIEIINKAVWVENTELDFYSCTETRWRSDESDETIGNSIYDDISQVNVENPERVEAIDIVEFIKDNFKSDDYIVLKLDIEGAEIEVMKHLIKSNLLNTHINEIHIEWHHKPQIEGLKYTGNKREDWDINENYFLNDLLKSKAFYKRWLW